MKILLFITSLLVIGSVFGQAPDEVFRITANVVNYSGVSDSVDITFRGNDLRGNPDLSELATGDLFFDADCNLWTVAAIVTPGIGPSSTIVASMTGTGFPSFGLGAIARPGSSGLIGQVQGASDRVNTCIDQYNTTVALASGGSVDQITTLADTTTIVMPAEGHVLIKQDSTLAAFYDGTQWLVLTGGGGGGGSGDDWGDQSVVTDGSTLDGFGTPGDPLGVNTTVIATRSYVTGEFDSRIERTHKVQAVASTSTVVLPTQVDTRYPVHIYRGAAYNESAFSGTASDWTISGTTATSNYRPLKIGERITFIYTELQ